MLYKLRIRVVMQNRYLAIVLGLQLLSSNSTTRYLWIRHPAWHNVKPSWAQPTFSSPGAFSSRRATDGRTDHEK